MPSLAQLDEEIAAKRKNLHAIFAKYGDEWADKMPADEAKSIKPMNDELSELVDKREAQFALEQVRKGVLDADGKPATPPDALKGQKADAARFHAKELGQILRESAEYKAFREGGSKTFRIVLNDAEFEALSGNPETKTLMTLSTINNVPTRLPGIRTSAQDQTTVGDLMLQGSTDNNAITYMEETTFTNNAAETSEGSSKPESALAFTERTDNVRKIATWIPGTKELFDDVAGFEAYVRGRLVFMVKRREEQQLLVGDGTAPNISGILDRSGIQTQALGTDDVPDAFYKAMDKVIVTGQADPTAIVMHPNDWQPIRLMRTSDGVYIWGSPSEAGPERLWGLPVRKTPLITENTGLVGAFTPHAQIFRRSGIEITVSTEHSTYFVENKVAVLAEERLALAVYRPAAFCTVTGI